MLQLAVGEIDWARERAAGLRQHLEAFAIEVWAAGKIVRDVEEDDLTDPHATLSAIDEFRSAEIALPVAFEGEVFDARGSPVQCHHARWSSAEAAGVDARTQRARGAKRESSLDKVTAGLFL